MMVFPNIRLAVLGSFLAYAPFVSSRCCPPGQFCELSSDTCYPRNCNELLTRLCGVESCCSCDSRESWSECPYEVCKSEGAMCVQVELPSGRLGTAVSCSSEFVFYVDKLPHPITGTERCKIGCSELSVHEIVIIDDEAICDDNGLARCQVGSTEHEHIGLLAALSGLIIPNCGRVEEGSFCIESAVHANAAGFAILAGLIGLVLCCCVIFCCNCCPKSKKGTTLMENDAAGSSWK